MKSPLIANQVWKWPCDFKLAWWLVHQNSQMVTKMPSILEWNRQELIISSYNSLSVHRDQGSCHQASYLCHLLAIHILSLLLSAPSSIDSGVESPTPFSQPPLTKSVPSTPNSGLPPRPTSFTPASVLLSISGDSPVPYRLFPQQVHFPFCSSPFLIKQHHFSFLSLTPLP